VGPPDSHGIPRAPRYSGTPLGDRSAFAYRAVTFCGCPFHEPSASRRFFDSAMGPPPHLVGPTTPAQKRRWAITLRGFRLVPVRSPLLRESRLLSSPRPTEMFHFGRFPPQALCVQTWVTGHDPGRVSPFGHLRIKALLTAPRSFSQPHASFIGSWRQGIHREPLLTWLVDARARYRVLKVHARTRLRPRGTVGLMRSRPRARTLRTEQCATPVSPQPGPAFHSSCEAY